MLNFFLNNIVAFIGVGATSFVVAALCGSYSYALPSTSPLKQQMRATAKLAILVSMIADLPVVGFVLYWVVVIAMFAFGPGPVSL